MPMHKYSVTINFNDTEYETDIIAYNVEESLNLAVKEASEYCSGKPTSFVIVGTFNA